MTEPTTRPPDWEAVKTDYFGGEKMTDIYLRHRITKGLFDAQRQRAGWPLRNKGKVNREKLVGRIFWLINNQIAAMEKDMDAGKQADVAVLNQLVGSLGRLIRFETGSVRTDKRRGRTTDLQDIREKLVRRIEELKRN